MALHLLLERVEIVALADLKADAHALRLRALAQHHRVVIDRVGEEDRVLFLGRQRHAEDVGVVVGLLFQVRHFVAGVGDLLHADHAKLSSHILLHLVGIGASARQRAEHVNHPGDIIVAEAHIA